MAQARRSPQPRPTDLDTIRLSMISETIYALHVHRPRWSSLSDKTQIHAGLELLVDFGWLAATRRQGADQASSTPSTREVRSDHVF